MTLTKDQIKYIREKIEKAERSGFADKQSREEMLAEFKQNFNK